MNDIIQELKSAVSVDNTTSLVSLYLPASTKIVDASKMISSEIAKSANIKARQTRRGVQAGLNSILTNLRTLNFTERGVALFAGETSTGFISHMVFPPTDSASIASIQNFLYRCDNKFHI